MTGQTLIVMSERPALKTVFVKIFCVAIVALFVGALVIEAYARGGGRGGGGGRSYSRAGPASGGSFASRGAGRDAAGRTEARQYGSSDRTASRQEGRTDRTEGRQDYRGDRQEQITDRQENRQDYRGEAREDWQDHYDDRWDNWGPWGYAAAGAAVVAGAYAIGSVVSADSYYALSCTPNTVVVDGVAYSQCGDAWYQPAYSGGTTTYVVVEPPAGY